MISLTDVLNGRVSLADIADVIKYLGMKSDIEYYNYEQNRKKGENHDRS